MGRFHFVRQIRPTFFLELTSQPSIQSFTNLSSHATSRWSYHCSLCCDYYNCCFYWSLSSYCLQDPKSCPIFWPNRALYFDSLQRFCYLLPPFSLQVKALVVDSSEDFWSTTDLTSDGTKFLVEKNLVFTEKGWTDYLIWFKYGLRWWVNGEEHCLFMVMVLPLWTFLNPGMITLIVNMYRASLKHAQPFCAPTQQRSSNSEMFVFGQPPKIPIPKILAWTHQEPVPKWNTIRHRTFGNELHTSPVTPRSFDGFG